MSVHPSLDAREALDDLQCPSRAEQAIQPIRNEVISYRRGKENEKDAKLKIINHTLIYLTFFSFKNIEKLTRKYTLLLPLKI